MLSQERSLTLFIAAFVMGVLLVAVFIIGLFSPFWCDVKVINVITCITEMEVSVDKQPAQLTEQAKEEGAQPVSEPTEYEPTTTVEFEDVEQAMIDDPILEQFVLSLKVAIEEADYQALGDMITEPFNMGPHGASYANLAKLQAIEFLKEEMKGLSITVDISNEGRKIAREEYVTPSEAAFALLSFGWPDETVSILGIKRVGENYLWSDLVLFISLGSD